MALTAAPVTAGRGTRGVGAATGAGQWALLVSNLAQDAIDSSRGRFETDRAGVLNSANAAAQGALNQRGVTRRDFQNQLGMDRFGTLNQISQAQGDIQNQLGMDRFGTLNQISQAQGDIQQQLAGAQQGILGQFGQTQAGVNPFIQQGQNQLGALQQGTTAGGLDQRLGQIFDTSIFGNLVDQRTRAVQGQLASTGLSRSGTALQEIAQVPTDVGLGIEQLLTGRSSQLAQQGQAGALGLGQIGADTFANLGQLGVGAASDFGRLGVGAVGDLGQRAIQGTLGSGQLGADVFSGLGLRGLQSTLGLGELETGAALGIGELGVRASLGVGQLGSQLSSTTGSLVQGQGNALLRAQEINAGLLGVDAQAQAARDANRSSFAGDIFGGLGALGGGLAQGIGAAGGAAAFFSDRNLKENVESIGKIGPLTLYQWDWIPETKDMIISKFPTMGFIADEVKERFPEFVNKVCGFDTINYEGLLDRLGANLISEGVS